MKDPDPFTVATSGRCRARIATLPRVCTQSKISGQPGTPPNVHARRAHPCISRPPCHDLCIYTVQIPGVTCPRASIRYPRRPDHGSAPGRLYCSPRAPLRPHPRHGARRRPAGGPHAGRGLGPALRTERDAAPQGITVSVHPPVRLLHHVRTANRRDAVSGVVIALGLLVLVFLSVAVGMILAGERDHRRRRRLDAMRWELWRWEQEIVSAAECRGCSSCALLRHRADLQRGPLD